MARRSGEKAHLELIIYDCRYDYEYEGGHIESAEHLDFKREADIFEQRHFYAGARPQSRNVIIVFHCEFSQKRGPSAYVGVRWRRGHSHACWLTRSRGARVVRAGATGTAGSASSTRAAARTQSCTTRRSTSWTAATSASTASTRCVVGASPRAASARNDTNGRWKACRGAALSRALSTCARRRATARRAARTSSTGTARTRASCASTCAGRTRSEVSRASPARRYRPLPVQKPKAVLHQCCA